MLSPFFSSFRHTSVLLPDARTVLSFGGGLRISTFYYLPSGLDVLGPFNPIARRQGRGGEHLSKEGLVGQVAFDRRSFKTRAIKIHALHVACL